MTRFYFLIICRLSPDTLLAVFVCIAIIIASSPAHALDCRLLRPKGGGNVSEELKGEIDGRIQGMVGRILGVQAEFQGTYLRIEEDVLNKYPNADKLYIWERVIFGFCQSLSESNISDQEKLDQWIRLLELYQLGPPEHGQSTLEKLRSITDSLQSAIEQTEDYIARLKKYPEKYDRVGELFNIPVCYEEIARHDAFENVKSSLFPSAAYVLLGTDNPALAHLELYDRTHKVLITIKQANDQKYMHCGPRIKACLRCRPSNLISAYLYKLTLRIALHLADLQLNITGRQYELDIARDVDRKIRVLECDFLREVNNDVAKAFIPKPIAASIRQLDRRCN